MTQSDVVRFMDFSLSAEPVRFRIAPDEFECLPEIPLDALADMTKLAGGGSGPEQLARVHDFFDGIMFPDSAALLRRRMRKGTVEEPNPHPVGMRHIHRMLPWLMEVYGLRPTQPSDESSTGSSDDAMSSTAGASDTASTS